jgi:hypothetical protein
MQSFNYELTALAYQYIMIFSPSTNLPVEEFLKARGPVRTYYCN